MSSTSVQPLHGKAVEQGIVVVSVVVVVVVVNFREFLQSFCKIMTE